MLPILDITQFRSAVDGILRESLDYKGSLQINQLPAGTDRLPYATQVIDRFVEKLAALLESSVPHEQTTEYLQAIAGRVESVIVAPVQCDLVDGSPCRDRRKAINVRLGRLVESMAEGTLILTPTQLKAALAPIVGDAKAYLGENSTTSSSSSMSSPPDLLTCISKVRAAITENVLPRVAAGGGSDELRTRLWEHGALPIVGDFVDYVRVMHMDTLKDVRRRQEVAGAVKGLLALGTPAAGGRNSSSTPTPSPMK
eukprot:PhM_4_TR11057/c0_g1_i1/m.35421